MHLRGTNALLAVAALSLVGCAGGSAVPGRSLPWGTPSLGLLRGGVALPEEGLGFVRARPGDDTRWGTARLVATLTSAAAEVEGAYPGTLPLRIGDLSGRGGGRHSRHASHRTGRDVDVIFYALDAAGRPIRGRGWVAFDRFGVARDSRALNDAERFVYFDEARNWRFVRALLTSEDAPVQWIFCSNGVKARLLEHALVHERDRELILRAAYVLHQPRDGRPHDDHFHVRLACTPEDRAGGCVDRGPLWPWLRASYDKTPFSDAALSDDAILAALFEEEGGEVAMGPAAPTP